MVWTQIVIRAQRGDQPAFERITLDIYERLHTVAHGILRDQSLVGDATTLLPDGRVLIASGWGDEGPVETAEVWARSGE